MFLKVFKISSIYLLSLALFSNAFATDTESPPQKIESACSSQLSAIALQISLPPKAKEQEPTLPPSNEVMSEDVIKVEDTTLDDLNDLQTDLDLTDLDSLEDDLSDIEDLNF